MACEHLVDLDEVTLGDQQLVVRRDAQRHIEGFPAGDLDAASAIVGLDDLDHAIDVADLGLALGHPGLEQLLDARQACRDVHAAGDAAGVERAHRQLGAGLADGLRRDDAHRLADADPLAGGQVAAVAGAADAVP